MIIERSLNIINPLTIDDGGIHQELEHEIITLDDTETVLLRYTPPANAVIIVDTKVTALRTGGIAGTPGDSFAFHFETRAKIIDTVLTISGDGAILSDSDNPAITASIEEDTGDLTIKVTGDVDNEISWRSRTSLLINEI